MSQVQTDRLPYKVKDINLAEWGRKEIELAEVEMRKKRAALKDKLYQMLNA